jgi:hypothetical protein
MKNPNPNALGMGFSKSFLKRNFSNLINCCGSSNPPLSRTLACNDVSVCCQLKDALLSGHNTYQIVPETHRRVYFPRIHEFEIGLHNQGGFI